MQELSQLRWLVELEPNLEIILIYKRKARLSMLFGWILRVRSKSLLMGNQKATDAIIMNQDVVDADERRERREIANHAMNKPSPKLQPSHNNTAQNMRINQP